MKKEDTCHSSFNPHPSSLLFVAGDVSGDFHAALLAQELQRRHPDWKLWALGGARLKASGAQMVGDTSGLGVIGFASALAILPRVLRLQKRLIHWIKTHRPDAVVLCDWGGFNTRLLPVLQSLGVPVLYYFPPRSWQKEGTGGLQIAPLVWGVATPFEWSARRLREAGCRAEWVGHPLLETVRANPSREELRQQFGVQSDETLVALLPGSRDLELQLIAPQIAGATRLLFEQLKSSLRFIVAVPPNAVARARPYFPAEIEIVEGRAMALLLACDAAIVKSGTATLEAAVADAPQIVVYDVPPLLRAQWKLTGLDRKIPFVAMPNIILDREIIPELLGDNCRPEPIARALADLLQNPARQAQMRRDYQLVRQSLGADLPQSATPHTADLVEAMLREKAATA